MGLIRMFVQVCVMTEGQRQWGVSEREACQRIWGLPDVPEVMRRSPQLQSQRPSLPISRAYIPSFSHPGSGGARDTAAGVSPLGTDGRGDIPAGPKEQRDAAAIERRVEPS